MCLVNYSGIGGGTRTVSCHRTGLCDRRRRDQAQKNGDHRPSDGDRGAVLFIPVHDLENRIEPDPDRCGTSHHSRISLDPSGIYGDDPVRRVCAGAFDARRTDPQGDGPGAQMAGVPCDHRAGGLPSWKWIYDMPVLPGIPVFRMWDHKLPVSHSGHRRTSGWVPDDGIEGGGR